MKILDGSFCIDYLNGDPATKPFYEANGSDSEQWVIPIPAYAEVVVGAGNIPEGDVDDVRSALGWAETHAIDEHTAALAGEIAAEVGPEEPFLDRPDALIAAVGRELDVPVVSADSDLTHPETKRVVTIEEYRK